jgi:hypothetical protein
MNSSVPSGVSRRSRPACRAGAACASPLLREDLVVLAQPVLGLVDHGRAGAAWLRRAGQPVVEMIRPPVRPGAGRLGEDSRSLVWPWNSGSRMKTDSKARPPAITSSAVIRLGALVAGSARHRPSARGSAPRAGPARGCRPGRRDGVAIGMDEAFLVLRPGDAHSTAPPWPFGSSMQPGEGAGVTVSQAGRPASLSGSRSGRWGIEGASAGGLRRALQQRRVAGPADFDAAEQIGLGPGHAVEPRRDQCARGAENLRRRDGS